MRIAGDIQLDGLNIVFDQASGTATTLLAGAPAGNITLNLPITADTLVGRATSDTLTNKTINASNNTVSNITLAMLASGVLNISTTLTGATDAQVPSALAAKTYTDNVSSTGLALKADKTTTMTAGTGLTGGGDLSANRTFNIANTAVTLGSYGSATAVGTFTVDQQGRLTAAADVAIQITQSQVTNLVTDLGNKASSAITITAGTGLSGGGDLTANRTLNIANTGVIATGYGGASSSVSMNVNAQGQITSASTVSIQIAESQVTNLVTDLGNKQPLDATLTALAGYNTNGLITQTAADTFTGRTITGTANRVTVSNGDGVSGNPTLDIGTDVVTLTGSQTLSNKTLTYVDTETESGTISANAITPAKGLYRITGGGTTLDTLTGTNDGQQVVIFNNSGADITVTNAGNIQTGTGANFTFKNGAATSLAYSSSATKWLLSGGAGGGGLATSLKSTTFTAAAGNHYLCSTSGGAYTATLPSGTTGSVVRFSDDVRTWGVSNLTLAPASGESIDGLATNETLVCDLTGAFVQLMWDGTRWVIDTNGYAAAITSGSLSSAQGMGAKNYIGNPNNATNWVASDAGILIATESTIANLPANSTQTSGIRITRVSGTTSYDRYRFTLDVADYSKKFAISFDQKYAGAAGDYTLAVYSNTASDYTGTSTQLTLQTSSLSALNGSFNTTVDMPGASAPYIEVRIIAAAGTTPLYLNNVYVGPGIITQGAAVGSTQTFVPTISGATTSSLTGKVQRIGDTARIRVKADLSTISGTIAFGFAAVGTIDTTGYPNSQGGYFYDCGHIYDSSTNKMYIAHAYVSGADIGLFWENGQGVSNSAGPTMTLATSDVILLDMTIPIAAWAGNGTVNLGAGAQQQFSGNSDTSSGSTGAGTTSTVTYGPLGNNFGTWTATTVKRVRSQYPIQNGWLVLLQISEDSGATWMPADQTLGLSASATTGITIQPVSGSTTDYDVTFGSAGYAATTRTGAGAWSTLGASWRWRVMFVNASSPIGFGLAGTDGSSGLVAPYSSSGVVYSGRWTFIPSGITNVSATTGSSGLYMRVGKIVTCSGFLNIDPASAANTATQVRIPLPIATTLTTFADIAGTMVGGAPSGTAMQPGYFGWISGSNADVFFNCTDASNNNYSFSFQYEIK
jgi:hypothetical protein